jgi:AhpD family alkylhydroperoxidase
MSESKINYAKISPEPFRRMRALGNYINTESGLEPTLLEFVRLRSSLLNKCHFCIDMHRHELKKMNETAERIAGLEDWRNTGFYTQRERAALAFAEAVTNIQDGMPDAVFAEASQHFGEKELVDLAWAIAQINAWNRLGVTFEPEYHEPNTTPASPEPVK